MNDKVLVTRTYMPPWEEYMTEIRDLWESHWITNMGVKHEQLRAALLDCLGVDYLELFVNGHMGIELTLQAFGFPKGSEIITTPFTFASTTHAIVRNGLHPVFCDVLPDSGLMDPDKIEGLITEKTKAILPVHVYGNICDADAIQTIADRHGLKVIYDAAHAFGEEYRGRPVGTIGDAACFSFHATKVFHTIEGGAVAYKDPSLGKILYQLKNFGIRDAETVDGIGANAKLNEFCAAMGLCNLRHFEEIVRARRKVTMRYRTGLKGIPGIRVLLADDGIKSNYAYFPVVFEETVFGNTRDDVCRALEKAGIWARKYFYPLTSSFDCFQGQFNSAKTPAALALSRRVLTLPLYPDLALEDVDRICGIVRSCYRG